MESDYQLRLTIKQAVLAHYPEKQAPETQQLPFCDTSVIKPNYLSAVQLRKLYHGKSIDH